MAEESTHSTKINIGGDASGAVSALSKVSRSLDGVFRAVSNVTKTLSRLNWAIAAVTTVVEAVKKFHEWTQRAETAAKNLRQELERTSYETKVAHAAASYEKLTKHLAETVRLEKERNDILEQRKRYERDLEDANAERNKQMEISALDPSSKDYAAQKKAIERKYEIAASEAKAARAGEDVRSQAAGLYSQADQKDAEAQAKEKEWKKQDAIAAAAQEKSWAAAMKARNGGDAEKEEAKKADEEFKRQFDKAKKIREEIDATLREAQSLRNKAAELAGGNVAANILNDANKQRIENEAKAEEAAEKNKDEDKKKSDDDKKKQREQNLEDKTLEKMKQDDLAQLNPSSPNYERDKREIERTYEIKALENKRDRATNDEDRKAAGEELEAIGIRHERERREERASLASGIADRAASFDGVSQNRLTAMGLGSGVSATGKVADDVRKIVDLLKQEVDESKKANQNGGEAAVYAE